MRSQILSVVGLMLLLALVGCPVNRTELEGLWEFADEFGAVTLRFRGNRLIARADQGIGPEYLELRGGFWIDSTTDPHSIDWTVDTEAVGVTIAGRNFTIQEEACSGDCDFLGIYEIDGEALRVEFDRPERPEEFPPDTRVFVRTTKSEDLNRVLRSDGLE